MIAVVIGIVAGVTVLAYRAGLARGAADAKAAQRRARQYEQLPRLVGRDGSRVTLMSARD